MNMFNVYRSGALALVSETMEYGHIHRKYGLSQSDWKLITQRECWNLTDRQKARSILAEVVQISLTIAGLPAQSLPGQYVAAVIAHIVSPSNMLVAATRAPEAFDAFAASGMTEQYEVRPMTIEQMQSLVIAYAGGAADEPIGHQLPRTVQNRSVDEEQ